MKNNKQTNKQRERGGEKTKLKANKQATQKNNKQTNKKKTK